VAQVTATTKGVSSPPTTVYVHQHVDKVVVSPIPGQITNPPTPPITLPPNLCTDPIPAVSGCFSQNQTFNYQATACNQGTDITSSVGTFDWQLLNTGVAGLNAASSTNPISGLLSGQAQVTAKAPGLTSFFASASGANSVPVDFTTCAVQSIQLQVNGTNDRTISVAKGSSQTVSAIVVDSNGTTITGVPLDWCSSQPANVSVGANNCATIASKSTAANTISVSTPLAGGGTVIATCTPPNCNIGLPSPTRGRPIYPENPIRFIVTPTTGAAQSATVYVSSTGCENTVGCISTIIPVTAPANTLGTAINLPATPNSLVFDPQGSNVYLGTDFSFSNSQGLMKVAFGSSTSVAQFKSVTGKVLAISPDGKKVIVSDAKSNPNLVFVIDTGTSTYVPFAIAGATAADFSPDALKAYIVAGNTLYVYSTIDPVLTIQLGGPANDVSFLANGAFAYVAGGNTSPGVTVWTNCTDTQVLPPVATTATPIFLKTLADASGILAVDPPNIDIISVSSAPEGCPPGPPVNVPVTPFSLGQGPFVPSQVIASADGRRVYLLTDRFGSVLVFNIDSETSSSIALTGSPLPLQASLTPDGTLLYVAANDGAVHVLNTQGAGDLVQITFPTNPETLLGGLCSGVTFPRQSVLNITAASPGGSSTTTYTYTVTSGPPPNVGATVVIQGMVDGGNNGAFVITALGSGTFTVVNSGGVPASNQNGTGNVSINCNPDLIAVRP
jgi:trimeric autotransporter adhesin